MAITLNSPLVAAVDAAVDWLRVRCTSVPLPVLVAARRLLAGSPLRARALLKRASNGTCPAKIGQQG